LADELRRRRWDLAVLGAAGLGLGAAAGRLDRWELLVAEALVVTVFACAHSLRGVSEDRPAAPVGPALWLTWLAVAGMLVVVGILGTVLGRQGSGHLLSRCILLAWAVGVSSAAEVAGRRFGPGPLALAVVSLPALACFLAPLLGSPFFPTGAGLALLASPVVSAGRALGIEVAVRPPLYELSSLGVVEFRYPPPHAHPILALILATGFIGRARAGGPT